MKHKLFIMVLVFALVMTGCYGALHLKTSYLNDAEDISGTFDVIFYGARYMDDPGSLVVLDAAGDSHQIVPRAIAGTYRIETGLAAEEALKKAIRFLKQNKYYEGVTYHAIHALDGSVVGYDMIPEYEQFTYLSRRPVSVNYFMGDNGTVNFHVYERVRIEHDIKTRD